MYIVCSCVYCGFVRVGLCIIMLYCLWCLCCRLASFVFMCNLRVKQLLLEICLVIEIDLVLAPKFETSKWPECACISNVNTVKEM